MMKLGLRRIQLAVAVLTLFSLLHFAQASDIVFINGVQMPSSGGISGPFGPQGQMGGNSSSIPSLGFTPLDVARALYGFYVNSGGSTIDWWDALQYAGNQSWGGCNPQPRPKIRVLGTTTQTVSDPNDGKNTLIFHPNQSGPNGVFAVTHITTMWVDLTTTPRQVASDIDVDIYANYGNGVPIPYGNLPTQVIPASLIAHELGHAFGLGHSQDPSDIMFPINIGTPPDTTVNDCSAAVDVNGTYFDTLTGSSYFVINQYNRKTFHFGANAANLPIMILLAWGPTLDARLDFSASNLLDHRFIYFDVGRWLTGLEGFFGTTGVTDSNGNVDVDIFMPDLGPSFLNFPFHFTGIAFAPTGAGYPGFNVKATAQTLDVTVSAN